MKMSRYAGPARSVLALVIVAWLAGSLWAQSQGQGQGQQQQQQQQQPPPQQPPQPAQPETPPVNPEEETGYKAFFEVPLTEPQRQIELGEEFLKKFPESRYGSSVYARLAKAYLATGQEEKMFAATEKALQLNPDNVDALALAAWVTPRRIGNNTLDREQKLQKSEGYSKRAIELLEAMARPEHMTEEVFTRARNENLAMCHSGLGLVFLHRQRFADSVTEFERAVQLSLSPEPTDLYLLGISYFQTKRYADSAESFRKCGEMSWQWQEQCKQEMEKAKKQAAAQLTPPKP